LSKQTDSGTQVSVISGLLSVSYKRRPRRPPFLRVLSDGIGVTSSATGSIHIKSAIIGLQKKT